MKTASLLTAAAVTMALSGAALAQGNGTHFFETWDGDKDGKVTAAEVENHRAEMFTSFDANSDGFLIAVETALMDEMRAHEQAENHDGQSMGQGQGMGMGMGRGGPGHSANGHMGFDGDGDGKVSKAEFIGQSKDWLAKFDRNCDGDVTSGDFGL